MTPFDLVPLLTAAEMRDWERACFSDGGLSERVVMESAGRAAALAIADAFPEGRIVAAVGKGNNGGDAVVALRTLRAWGREVAAVRAGTADAHAELTHRWEIPSVEWTGEESFGDAGVLVDGLLGTGASGAPRAPYGSLIHALNGAGAPIVALDGPSGVDLTTGEAAGEAVRAELTVTFGALKRGLLIHPGRQHAGHIVLAEVGFPEMRAGQWSAAVTTHGWARARLPKIPADAHKGSVGLVAVAAGREGLAGAAILATMGALRAGAGGVWVVSAAANRVPIQTAVPEAMFRDRDSPDLEEALRKVASIVAGPAIGTDAAGEALLRRAIESDAPLAIDADGLTLLARKPELLPRGRAASCVLTPHPGELARLLGRETEAVVVDRFAAAAEAAEKFGATVLAKGAPSLVASAEAPVLVNTTGHSGVATGGTGDTLVGIVAALLAMGCPPREAAALGVHFSGRAADIAGKGRGLLPRDLSENLPEALEEELEERPDPPFLYELPPAR